MIDGEEDLGDLLFADEKDAADSWYDRAALLEDAPKKRYVQAMKDEELLIIEIEN